MNNKRATKRALLTSVTALVMCVVMLVGTTFAWFTDTASTGVNKIQAGNLDVALEMNTGTKENPKWENAEGKTLQFKTADGRTDNILWEPGCRYQLPELRVVNNGNLALKYIIKVTGIETNHEVVPGEPNLKDVITWEIKYSDDAVWNVEADTFKAGYSLAPNASNVVTIKGEMDKNAGNEYQGLSIDGVSVTVYATQMTAEFDSFNNEYDKDAAYKGSQEFTSGTHVLNKGGVALATDARPIAVFATGSDTNVTITGGYYDGGSGGEYNIAVWANGGANVTIKDGTFTVGADKNGEANSVIYSTGGNITIEGGFFYTDYSSNGFYYVLNQQNGNPGTITVKGGTFVNYDPSTGDDNLGGNFVADGYSVITETKANGDTWYTVVKGTGVTAGTQEALKDALTNADTTSNALTVKLAGGEYTLYNVNSAKTKNTELTIEGAGKDKTVFTAGDMTVTDANGEGSSDYSYEGSDVTFKNMTVNVGTGNYKGFVRAKSLYFENCTIEGRGSYWGIGSVVFKDCIFNSVDDYNIWTYAGMDFTFDNCTFNSDAGKFVNAYKEQATGTTKLTFTDCKFVAGTENKPAVCLKGYQSNAWDVTFSGCSLTKCKTDATTGSNYYLIEDVENATTVTIDGKVVWENGAKK